MVVPGTSVFLADFEVVGFDSTLAEDQDGTGVGANWRMATVPGALLGSLPMLTVALLAWLPPSTLTVG